MTNDYSRKWQDLSWLRLIAATSVAPLPALYLGFSGVLLFFSDRNVLRLAEMALTTAIYIWGFAFLFTMLYLNLISRMRKSVGLIECIVAGGVSAFLLAEAFFVAVELEIVAPLPTMVFFPLFFIRGGDQLLQSGALLGLVVMPAGALSGWIFWRIGVAAAPKPA